MSNYLSSAYTIYRKLKRLKIWSKVLAELDLAKILLLAIISHFLLVYVQSALANNRLIKTLESRNTAQWAKGFVPKSADLSSMPGTLQKERTGS